MSSLAEMTRPVAEQRAQERAIDSRAVDASLSDKAFLRGPVQPELIRDEVLPEIFLATRRGTARPSGADRRLPEGVRTGAIRT